MSITWRTHNLNDAAGMTVSSPTQVDRRRRRRRRGGPNMGIRWASFLRRGDLIALQRLYQPCACLRLPRRTVRGAHNIVDVLTTCPMPSVGAIVTSTRDGSCYSVSIGPLLTTFCATDGRITEQWMGRSAAELIGAEPPRSDRGL